MDESLRFTSKVGIPTDIVTDIRSRTQIIIKAGSDTMRDYSGQVMLEVAANLLARIFPHVAAEIDSIPAEYLKTQQPLDNHLHGVIKDSYIWDGVPEKPKNTFYLVVGNAPVEGTAVYIDADGWLSYVGIRPSGLSEKTGIKVPIGPVVSACLGVSEIFKIIYKDYIQKNVVLIQDGIWFNSLSYNNEMTPNLNIENLHLNRVVLFGSGSVGSSLLYVLSFLSEVTGKIDIVDRDKKVDNNNLQRYSFLTVSDVSYYQGVTKAHWAADKIKRRLSGLNLIPWDGETGEIVKYIDANPLRPGIKLALSAVDNVEARIQITDCLAERTLNAGTGDTTLTITRHGFSDGKACLACDYIAKAPNINWYQEVSNKTSLTVDRVAILLQGKALLDRDDLEKMTVKGFISIDQVDSLLNTDLSSLVNRRLYSAVNVQNEGIEKPVTAPYVSTMAGALLAGELLKEVCGLQHAWENNKYRTDMLNLPVNYTTLVPKENKNCLCLNHFRKQKFKELWPD